MPPWKSLLQFNSIGTLMPKNRAADFAAEVFGVMKHEVDAFLPDRVVNKCFVDRPRDNAPPQPSIAGDPLTVWVGVDLAGHSKSELGLCALVAGSGRIILIGAASVSVARCQMSELQAIVRDFTKQLRAHPWVDARNSIIVPVIECNLNEVSAMSLLAAFEEFPPLFMPFTADRFPTLVTPGVGVWTNEDTKLASLQVHAAQPPTHNRGGGGGQGGIIDSLIARLLATTRAGNVPSADGGVVRRGRGRRHNRPVRV